MSAASAQSTEPALAVVRPDGILMPVALFDGSTWIDPWPAPSDDRKLDRMIEALPSYWRDRGRQVPQTWHVASRPSGSVTAKVLSHVIFDEHCGNQAGLLTDLPRREDDLHEKAIATSWPQTIEWPIDLTADAKAREPWQPLIQAALNESARQELHEISEWEARTGRRSALEPANERTPFEFERLDAHEEGEHRLLYFETRRQYAKSIGSSPGQRRSTLLVTGWIVASRRAAPLTLEASAHLGGPEFTVRLMKPLGLFRMGGEVYWIAQQRGYESEAVALMRVDGGTIKHVYRKLIGGC